MEISDLKKFIKDDKMIDGIIETCEDIKFYYNVKAMMELGFNFSFKDIPFYRASMFSAITYELNKQKKAK